MQTMQAEIGFWTNETVMLGLCLADPEHDPVLLVRTRRYIPANDRGCGITKLYSLNQQRWIYLPPSGKLGMSSESDLDHDALIRWAEHTAECVTALHSMEPYRWLPVFLGQWAARAYVDGKQQNVCPL